MEIWAFNPEAREGGKAQYKSFDEMCSGRPFAEQIMELGATFYAESRKKVWWLVFEPEEEQRRKRIDYVKGVIDLARALGRALAEFRRATEELKGTLDKELEADDAEMTRTRKVRRRHVAEKYAAVIDAFYGGLDEVEMATTITYEDGRQAIIQSRARIEDVAARGPAHV